MESLEGYESLAKGLQETSLQTCIGNEPVKRVFLGYRKDYGELTLTEVSRNSSRGICIWTLEEIRQGKVSSKGQWRKFPESVCFTIFWGTEFQLESLTFAAKDERHVEIWVNLLQALADRGRHLLYQTREDIWIRTYYDQLRQTNKRIHVDQLKICSMRLGYHEPEITRRDFRSHCNIHGIELKEFHRMIKKWLHCRQAYEVCFQSVLRSRVMLTTTAFREFICREQGENFNDIFEYNFRVTIGPCKDGVLEPMEVLDHLFSKENDLWDPESLILNQDMTRPLAHYYIASSHNTYLVGHQLVSDSSVQAFIRCLRMGCRCIELDCWDGPREAIRDHAFDTTEYPLILSIENHCSPRQQKFMACKFKEVFGSMIVTSNAISYGDCTPEKLKRRIILKCKRFNEDVESTDLSASVRQDTPEVLQDAIKTGKMYMLVDGKDWKPHFVSLTSNNIKFIEIPEMKSRRNGGTERRPTHPTETQDLHLYQRWYHGKITSDAGYSRLQMNGTEGAFLVRESHRLGGQYVLCVLSRKQPRNVRICATFVDSQRLYHVVNLRNERFPSIFALICYYQDNSLDIPTTNDSGGLFIQRLAEPVPVPRDYDTEEWFYPDVDRNGAERVLKRINVNGAFLVRYAQSIRWTLYVISFRYHHRNGVLIKHCRIKSEGCKLIVLDKSFNELTELVQFYCTNRFYKDMMLQHPVTKKLYTMAMAERLGNANEMIIFGDYGYSYTYTTEASDFMVEARAIRKYQAPRGNTEYLSFETGDIITNVVVGEEGDLWVGDLGSERQKKFPSYCVEVVQADANSNESSALHSRSTAVGQWFLHKMHSENPLQLVKIKESFNPRFRYVIESEGPFKAGLETLKEAKKWRRAINTAYKEGKRTFLDKIFDYVTRPIHTMKLPSPVRQVEAVEDLSRLIYLEAIRRKDPSECFSTNEFAHNEITSYNDGSALRRMGKYPEEYSSLHQTQMCRVYPNGSRTNSGNYNPIPMWNVGAQMVALNYQTPDSWMEVNCSKFYQNGGSGYVLKPDFLFKSGFDPNDLEALERFNIKGFNLTIRIIGGRHLIYKESHSPDPYVVIEILGADFDHAKASTREGSNWQNGLSPYWDEKFDFTVRNPELAFIRFVVYEKNSFDEACLIGSASYPVSCIRSGYRSVQLFQGYDDSSLARLLVHVTKEQLS